MIYECSVGSTRITRVPYHKIIIGAIAAIATFGFAVPFAASVHCDLIPDFDPGCYGQNHYMPSPMFGLAGAEIYYEHLIYQINPHLREDPGSKDEVFTLSGDIPGEFSNQVRLTYDEQHSNFVQDPRPALIHLGRDPTVTVLSESKLGYDVISNSRQNRHVIGAMPAEGSWSHGFESVGSYSYRLEPQSEHDTRNVWLQILVIDEPIEDMPKSIRHNIACSLMSVDRAEFPFYNGMSCGGSSGDPITVSFDKVVMGAGPQYRERLLDRMSQDAGFLEPEVAFEYENSDMFWHIWLPLVLSEPVQQGFWDD